MKGWSPEWNAFVPSMSGYVGAKNWGVKSPLEPLFDAVRSTLVGTRVETTTGGRVLGFTLREMNARFETLGSAAGQAEDVSFSAEDVVYDGLRVDRVNVTARNVHTRIGVNPVLVTAPLDIELSGSWHQVNALLQRYASDFLIEPTGSQRARVRLAQHPRWGWLDVGVETDAGAVGLRLLRIGRGTRSLGRGGRRVPVVPLPVSIDAGVRIIDLTIDRELVTAVIRVDAIRVEYARVWALVRKGR